MDLCEKCGAEFDPARKYLHLCESCGWESDADESCFMCGGRVERDEEWWEDGLCDSCAAVVGRP